MERKPSTVFHITLILTAQRREKWSVMQMCLLMRDPLKDRTITFRDSGLTVSNEFTNEPAKVEYKSGKLLMIQSGDARVIPDEEE